MDPYGPVVRRLPLVARPRPACLPLPQRVDALVELAATAADKADPSVASTVHNQAALIASDVGDPELAREMCRQHAAAYLHAAPLPAAAAIRALEPVVNLARLQIRAGNAEGGHQRLLTLYESVSNGTGAAFDGIHVPADLTASETDRHEARAWLWRVVLADGTRALTSAGRWADALNHLKKHRGIGQRMLDGRQVAVIATLSTDPAGAATLVAGTAPGEPWEKSVTACMDVMCHRALGKVEHVLTALATSYLQRESLPEMTVFDVRLGLTILDLLEDPEGAAARQLICSLHHRINRANDGYAARDCLADTRFTSLATPYHAQEIQSLVRECALGSSSLPDHLAEKLKEALKLSNHVIRSSISGQR